MEQKVLEYMKKHHMVESGDRVLIGLSGGADSAALFHILREYQQVYGYELLAVHVNHGLRGEEALRDQEFVMELCRSCQVPCEVVKMPVRQMAEKGKMSLEEAGREARREVFQRLAGKWKCSKLALAHHKNDQAETMLHHLARGTGLAGLAGLLPADGFRIRPFLCLEREEIDHYLQVKGYAYVEDSSNRDDQYTRNRIRHELLAGMTQRVNERAVEHMAMTAQILRQTDSYLEDQGQELLRRYQKQNFLEEAFFQENPVPVYYGLRVFLSSLFAVKDMSASHYEALQGWAGMQVGKVLQLPHKICARREYGGVLFYREGGYGYAQTKESFCMPLQIPGTVSGGGMQFRCRIFKNFFQQIPQKTYTKWLDYDKIKNTVVMRNRQPGDYLVVNASGGKKKLKDYLIDCKVPREKRGQIILAAQGQEILWAVGLRLSEAYKVGPDTREVLEIVYEGGVEDEAEHSDIDTGGGSRGKNTPDSSQNQ